MSTFKLECFDYCAHGHFSYSPLFTAHKDILDSAKNEINSRNSSETTEQKLEMAEKEIEICNHEIQDLKVTCKKGTPML